MKAAGLVGTPGKFMEYSFYVELPLQNYVFVQQEVAKYAQTFLEFPPMQKGASFNMQALKEELEKKMARQGQ